MENSEIIRRVKAWQSAGFLHPLTCTGPDHGMLEPVEANGVVILKCPWCNYIQEHIPEVILDTSPEQLAEERVRLVNMGFRL